MNHQSLLRLELIQRYTSTLKANPACQALVIVGSVSRGICDENSDIDTLVVFNRPVSEQEYELAIEEAKATGGALHYGTPVDFAVYHFVEGIKIDFAYAAVERHEQDLKRMVEDPTTDLITQLIVSGFLEGMAIHGEQWVQEWKLRLKTYPPALSDLMIQQHLRFFPFWAINTMGIQRHDVLWVSSLLLEASQNLIGILFGLNRAYHPGKMKGVEWWMDRLAVKPPDFMVRIKHLLRAPHDEALVMLRSLVEETLVLIETFAPHIDLKATRSRLNIELRR